MHRLGRWDQQTPRMDETPFFHCPDTISPRCMLLFLSSKSSCRRYPECCKGTMFPVASNKWWVNQKIWDVRKKMMDLDWGNSGF